MGPWETRKIFEQISEATPTKNDPFKEAQSLPDNSKTEVEALKQLKALNFENIDTVKHVFVKGLRGQTRQ